MITNSGQASLQVSVVAPGYDLLWLEFAPANSGPVPPTGERIVGAQSGFPASLADGVVTRAGNGEVSLNWVPSESATNYNVKRAATSAGPYATIASIPSLSYLDSEVTNGSNYYYAISAVNAYGEGADSTPVNATPHSGTLTPPFMDQDVGLAALWSGDASDVGFAGSASYLAGAYTVTGSGIDIWSQLDSFHYVYRAVSGDCTNIIRVVSLQNTDPYAKAGLMLRETLNPDSANAFMTMTAQNGALFTWRPTAGAASASSAQSGVTAPYWVKLVSQRKQLYRLHFAQRRHLDTGRVNEYPDGRQHFCWRSGDGTQ